MRSKSLDNILIGAALAAAASALLPIAKSTLRPMLAAGLEKSGGLLDRARSCLQVAREEMEDIVAEAQFERMKKRLDKEIAGMDPVPDQ